MILLRTMLLSANSTAAPARAGPRTTGEDGYSLVELLVATMLSTMILGGMYSALFQTQVAFEAQLDAMAARQQARIAVDNVVPEVRMAGFRIGNLPEAIEGAAADWITFVGDIDNGSPELPCDATIENATNGGAERVTYAVSGTFLVRAVECWNGTKWSDGVKEIVAREVVTTGPVFRYFDGAGVELRPGANGLSAAQRASVRSATFTIAVAEPQAANQIAPGNNAPGLHTITNGASLRNIR